MSRTKVLHSFGREGELDRPAVERLVSALTKLLDPAAAAALTGPVDMTFTDSRPMGGAWVLDGLWQRLGVDTAIGKVLAGRRVDGTRVERILFALTANRALKPSSKLAATEWIAHDVHITGLSDVLDEACYRAMDQLVDIETVLAKEIYHQVADLLNLEVDLFLFDTTSTYFETGDGDELHPVPPPGMPGHRSCHPRCLVGGRTFDRSREATGPYPSRGISSDAGGAGATKGAEHS